MAKARTELTWTEIDPASLGPDLEEAYKAYKQAYAEMKRIRAGFEASLQRGAPAGKRIVCGYNFGKLSIALADAAPEKPKQASGTLAEWLAQQAASGRRA